MLSEACENGRVKYGTTQGDAEFREKISKHASLMYDVEISPKDVLVTAGARFAIYLAMQTLLEQGDEVIIIEPAWPAYSQCAINVGAKARIVRTTFFASLHVEYQSLPWLEITCGIKPPCIARSAMPKRLASTMGTTHGSCLPLTWRFDDLFLF